jgi:hypothetical protein
MSNTESVERCFNPWSILWKRWLLQMILLITMHSLAFFMPVWLGTIFYVVSGAFCGLGVGLSLGLRMCGDCTECATLRFAKLSAERKSGKNYGNDMHDGGGGGVGGFASTSFSSSSSSGNSGESRKAYQ